MRVGVVGAGSWGTTLADLLARKGYDVHLWAREPDVVSAINRTHFNPVFLPGAPLAPTLKAAPTIGEVVKEAELVICVPPSHAMRGVGQEVAAAVSASAVVVSASKGLEPGTLDTMTGVLEDVLPNSSLVALSGPSFAQEVHARQPTAVVAASRDPAAAELTQQLLSARHFRVYRSGDVIGVELGGALKNVIAIAAGILEGMGLGNNTRAALITRGLAEMTRLGEALGADPSTFAGLAGMGDLILTATGTLSRNRSLGVEIGHGRTLAEILAERRTVAEGVGTSQAAVELGRRAGVELPIAYEVRQVLFEGKQPSRAIADLMDRELKAERWR